MPTNDHDADAPQRLSRERGEDGPPPDGAGPALEGIGRRSALGPEGRAHLLDPQTLQQRDLYRRHVEHFLGTVKVPVGVVGPLRVNGRFARGEYLVPMATTEAALVASYHRGARLLTEAGGCTAALLSEGVSRVPGFAFRDLHEAGRFVAWVGGQLEEFRRRAESTTRHGRLTDLRIAVEGNHVYLAFEFTTGDACGQNMVTLATEAICDYIRAHSPVAPRFWFLEANLSGDKKASHRSLILGRGRTVCAEALLPGPLLKRRLRTTPAAMADYWPISVLGGVLGGAVGSHGHYANGMAALYLATGQDVACVAESAVGVTRLELSGGDLYASVTLPNVMVGTVGGGTALPSQHACLELLGLAGPGKARALAEVCAALCLAGELSLVAALCSGDFARAHRLLARGRGRTGRTAPEGEADG